MIADNKLALNAGWNEELLAAELERLKEDGVALDLLGFAEDELDRLLDGLDAGGASEGEDEVSERPAEAVTRPGGLSPCRTPAQVLSRLRKASRSSLIAATSALGSRLATALSTSSVTTCVVSGSPTMQRSTLPDRPIPLFTP